MTNNDVFTIDTLKDALPASMSKNVTERIFEQIKHMSKDADGGSAFMEENLFRYSPLLKDIKSPHKNDPIAYASAVKFCTLIVSGWKRTDAWKETFKDRAEKLMAKNGIKNIDNIVSAYINTELVSAIQAKMYLATHIQYAPFKEKALLSLFDLMNGKAADTLVMIYAKDDNGNTIKDRYGRKVPLLDENKENVYEVYKQQVSPNVQMLAAKAILEETRIPEDKTLKLELSITEEEVMATNNMAKSLKALAQAQALAVSKGASVEDVQQIGNIIDVNIEGN